ncbi:MAG: hypothetical protein TREMPRED_002726 [Tremellales sp. Tagirdzhanova-0007]|nr:MAG: hypothetical protein TREMPRED_002726 [Tremellales sp. Tagirdzhanova-0007]
MSVVPSRHTAVGILNKNHKLASFQVETPTPGPTDVLVKPTYTSHTPISLWQVDFAYLCDDIKIISGNIVGQVVAKGDEVKSVSIGEMVMGFSFGSPERSPMQEYVLAKENYVSKIPPNLSPQEAVTIPDSFVSAYHTIATELGIPLPIKLPARAPEDADMPILVWGGSSSVGNYTLQILQVAGYHNVIVTASERSFVSLRPLAAHLVSYEDLSSAISTILARLPVTGPVMVIDCIGDASRTVEPIAKIVHGRKGSKVAVMLPVRVGGTGKTVGVEMEVNGDFGEGVEVLGVRTHFYEKNEAIQDVLQPSIMLDWVTQGYIKPMRMREIEGETFLERCEKAMNEIRESRVRGEKLVTKVA